jgi:hypothetical protein
MNEFTKWFELRVTAEKPDGESIMDRLFRRLDGAYPNKWRSNFPTTDAIDNWKTSWAEAFEEEKITLCEIGAGIKVCRKTIDWPPSCSEFIKACRPSADSLKAYYEAVAGVQARNAGKMGVWSHPAIFWAATPLAFDLCNQTFSQIKMRWEAAYNYQMERAEWEPIPQVALALPAPGRAELSRENAAKMLSDLGASGVLKTRNEDTAWYRKILDRIKRGDKTVSMIQRQFAEQAATAHGYKQ